MKKFRITEQQYAAITYFYTVEANSEEEAREMIFKGEVEHDEYTVDYSNSGESYFDVSEETEEE